jgi:bla regulator protein BlaR1
MQRLIGNLLLLSAAGAIAELAAQSSDAPDWQTAAGGKMAFEVASVKPAAPELWHAPNFPLDNRNAFVPGGRFSATFPVGTYISFAYKLSPDERRTALAHLPAWVDNDNFAIEARAPASSTKDQMRLMMQSLLADRFKLAVHFETREVPVFALTPIKPGQTGPKLRPHSAGPPCPDSYTGARPSASEVFPPNCGDATMWMNGP